MYEIFSIGPNGGHAHTKRDTLEAAMRFAWDHANASGASIISITNTETGEDCGDYIDYADKAGWLDLLDTPLH